MRQLIVRVPRGRGQDVLRAARRCRALDLALFEADGGEDPDGGPLDVVLLNLPNPEVEEFIEELQPLEGAQVTLAPRGVIPLQPAEPRVRESVKNVGPRSPIEVFLGGLQSIGSWKGFLGYAAAAGVVVWVGLATNNIYLLVAAMLIAPFAGPAMNAAIAAASGDTILLRRSLLRYFASLALTVAVAALLTLLLGHEAATTQMIEESQVASVAVLLPLVAGAAGALNLVQSERSSLVSGAAVGMLVAASLAPPAGLMGMALALGMWEVLKGAAFVLLLQLAGINLSGSVIFRAFGLSAHTASGKRGHGWVFPASLAASALVLASLLAWQFSSPPHLQRSSRAQAATAEVQRAVEGSSLARLVEARVRFTRSSIEGQDTLLCVVYVERRAGVAETEADISASLTRAIQARLLERGFNVTPLVDVRVLGAPSSG